MNVISVKDLKFNSTGTIDGMVLFEEFNEYVPFTASPGDIEEHGRLIYAKAINGDYGQVQPYVELAN